MNNEDKDGLTYKLNNDTYENIAYNTAMFIMGGMIQQGYSPAETRTHKIAIESATNFLETFYNTIINKNK